MLQAQVAVADPLEAEFPRARKNDPETSKEAASKAGTLARAHYTMIVDALSAGPATIYEISERTGHKLDHVAVARRMSEMCSDEIGLARLTGEKRPGPTGRNCQVYDLPLVAY